jgi:hypothetical protein
MNRKEDLIVSRMYQKGAHFLALYVREVSGGDIDGSVFQFETHEDNIEDLDSRVMSGDIYYVRNRYFAKLLNLLEEGWKKTNVGLHANQHSGFFNPEVL